MRRARRDRHCPAEQRAENQRAGDRCDREADALRSGTDHRGHVHAEAETDDGRLQQQLRPFRRLLRPWVAEREADRETDRKRDRGRDPGRQAGDSCDDEDCACHGWRYGHRASLSSGQGIEFPECRPKAKARGQRRLGRSLTGSIEWERPSWRRQVADRSSAADSSPSSLM